MPIRGSRFEFSTSSCGAFSPLFHLLFVSVPARNAGAYPNLAIPGDRDPRERGSRPLNNNR
jgi:hypothetical protein